MISLALLAVTAFVPVPMPVEDVAAVCSGSVPFVFVRSDNNAVAFAMSDKSQEGAVVAQDFDGMYILMHPKDGFIAVYNVTTGIGGKLKEEYKCFRLYKN
jgi:hypothetical protein